MRKIFIFLLLFFLLAIQIAIVPYFNFFGIKANILLAAILSFVVFKKTKSILIWAAVAGLIIDFFSALPFGLYCLTFILVVWLIDFIGRSIFKANEFWGQLALMFCGSIVFSILFILLLKIFNWLGLGAGTSGQILFWRAVLLEIGLNTLLGVAALFAIKKIYGLFSRI